MLLQSSAIAFRHRNGTLLVVHRRAKITYLGLGRRQRIDKRRILIPGLAIGRARELQGTFAITNARLGTGRQQPGVGIVRGRIIFIQWSKLCPTSFTLVWYSSYFTYNYLCHDGL